MARMMRFFCALMTEPKKRPAPFSLRIAAEFLAVLRQEADAFGMSLHAYVLWLIDLGRVSVGKGAVQNRETSKTELTQAFATFGKSGFSSLIIEISNAVRSGSLPVSAETEKLLNAAMQAVIDLRDMFRKELTRRGRKP